MLKKITLILIIAVSSSYGATCYTAANGFMAIQSVSTQMQSQSQKTNFKLNELMKTVDLRDKKIKELLQIEESIKLINQAKYDKKKLLINSLKVKNELRSKSITLEQIIRDLSSK